MKVLVGLFVVLVLNSIALGASAATILSGPPPASGKQFTTLPPGSALPSDTECANRVRRTTWEPRLSNSAKNQYVPVKGADFNVPRFNGTDQGIFLPGHATAANVFVDRLSGNFTGTTDEILQWAACKWGIDEDMVRAQAVTESNWDMAVVGDNGESFGILQVRTTSQPGAFPGAQKSTAFNADYVYMRWRLCFEGLVDYLAQTGPYVGGDPWGCMGVWYTGNWYGSGGGGTATGAQAYINIVKQHLNARTWEGWTGTQVTQPPVTTTATPSPSPTPTSSPTITPAVPTSTPSPTSPAGCSKKKTGDADCDGVIRLADFEIWRKEYFPGCSAANRSVCLEDADHDGDTMDANFDYPGSGTATTDMMVGIIDFQIWRTGYFAGA